MFCGASEMLRKEERVSSMLGSRISYFQFTYFTYAIACPRPTKSPAVEDSSIQEGRVLHSVSTKGSGASRKHAPLNPHSTGLVVQQMFIECQQDARHCAGDHPIKTYSLFSRSSQSGEGQIEHSSQSPNDDSYCE